MNKYWLNLAGLLILAGGIYLVVDFSHSTAFLRLKHKWFSDISGRVSAVSHNFRVEFDNSRKRPLTFIDKEEKLTQFIPFVFGKFTRRDWENFWDACYNPQGKGFFTKKRYLTKQEIKEYLIHYFPDLSYLQDVHWKYFWEIVYGQ